MRDLVVSKISDNDENVRYYIIIYICDIKKFFTKIYYFLWKQIVQHY